MHSRTRTPDSPRSTLGVAFAFGAVLAGSATACADRPPAGAPTCTTGAPIPGDEAHGRIADLERERDEARAALAQDRATAEGDRIRRTDDAMSKSARDELEVRVMTALGKADEEGQMLRAKLLRASGKQRQRLETALVDAHAIRAKIFGDIRRLHGGDLGPSWDAFRADVDKSLSDLSAALAVEPDLTDVPDRARAR